MKHAKLILFFTLVLVISITSTNSSDGVFTDNIESEGINLPTIEFKVSYEEHSAITIYGDSDFETQAASEEWDGEGTELSPYLIQGYNITDSFGGVSIYDVSLYFEISDCLITYPTPQGRTYGMYFNNVTHLTVTNCTINNLAIGIGLINLDGATIDNCTITNAINDGMWIDDVENSTVNDCTIFNTTLEAIEAQFSEYCKFTNNRLYDNEAAGIRLVSMSDFCEITGNTIYNSGLQGIEISDSEFCNITDNQVYDNGGPGILLDTSDNCTIQNNIVYGNSIGMESCGIDLTSSANCTIIGNELYENEFAGINLQSSPNCDILSNTIYNNSDHGIYGVLSDNTTIIDNDIYENGWWGMVVETCGISFGETTRWYIEGNNIWNNSANGIWCQADYTTIKDNVIFNNTDHGIYSDWTDNLTIIGNTIYGNGWDSEELELCGIYLDNVEDTIIDSNTIYNNTDNGIALIESINITVINNEIYDNARNGIYAMAENCILTSNTIYRNAFDGIVLDETTNCNVTHNIIFDNAQYGVSMNPADQCWIYYNDIGWNSENAYDASSGDWNSWDDNVSIGNWWHDYSGSGNYTISGSFADNDTAPSKSMYVQGASPMEYEAGTIGQIMTWTAYALNPDSYEFYVDEELFDSDVWDGSDIGIDVTGIDTGLHDVMLIVYHISGHSFNSTSTVDVVDTLAPTWGTPPQDQMVEFGDSFSYQLSASDISGIASWTVNDTSNFAIDSNGLLTNSTTLQLGVYVVIISVEDIHGNTLSIEISITVHESSITTTTDPDAPIDPVLVLVLGGGGAFIVVVIVLIGVGKKRGA